MRDQHPRLNEADTELDRLVHQVLLDELDLMVQQGMLSREEYEAQKTRLLNG